MIVSVCIGLGAFVPVGVVAGCEIGFALSEEKFAPQGSHNVCLLAFVQAVHHATQVGDQLAGDHSA